MRIHTACMVCAFAEIEANPAKPRLGLYHLELRDDGLYSFTCEKGHKNITALQQQRFEVLSELAVNAIVDGYYREAIASFASAMERFFEFYVRVIARARGVPSDIFDGAWKHVSKLSERQLGCYIFAGILEERCTPPLLSINNIQFRNDVIHRGLIPSREQAIKFGDAVLEVIRPALVSVKQKYADAIMQEVLEHNRKGGGSIISMPTLINLARAETAATENVEQAMIRVAEARERFGGAYIE